MNAAPSVSLVVTTARRPAFLALALRALDEQDYRGSIETLVVADGPPCLGGATVSNSRRIIETGPITLGSKLALGVRAAQGDIVMKIDDDDWYGPGYVARMVAGLSEDEVALAQPFDTFDLRTWQVRSMGPERGSGGTLTFWREAFASIPFQDLRRQVDLRFLLDAFGAGKRGRPVTIGTDYLHVRHAGPHLWTHMDDGRSVDDVVAGRPLARRPETRLPGWALREYRALAAAAAPSRP